MKQLLMGNEAIAMGAIAAGVNVYKGKITCRNVAAAFPDFEYTPLETLF